MSNQPRFTDTSTVMPASHPSNLPQARPAVVIDHRFFPHIIDLIISFLSYPGLIHCSIVCKSWRKDAHRRLIRHVAVFEYEEAEAYEPGAEPVLVRSRNLDWPAASTTLIDTFKGDFSTLAPVHGSSVVDCYFKCFKHDQAVGSPSYWPRRFQRLLECEPSDTPPETGSYFSDSLDWTDIVHFIEYDGDLFRFGSATPACSPKT